MATLVVPPLEQGESRWPTLGPQVCTFLNERAVFGPGDKRGDPYVVDAEVRGLLSRAYEVFPQGHPKAGQRRFKRVAFSLRKGSRKTEIGALVAFAELHPEGPIRCDRFDSDGVPVGVPVRDPYIPMVAYTEEQTEELAYGALYVIVTEGPDVDLFDPGLERIQRAAGDGKAEALSSSPSARDGARTTFQHFDETHRMTLPRLVAAHQTMLANIPKRPLADPWSLETTTAPEPGGGSVAENTMEYAKAVDQGKIEDSRLFFFHRQASKGLGECDTTAEVRTQVIEASGPVVAEWSDVDGIVSLIQDPTTDQSYAERVWLNRETAGSEKAFDLNRWKQLSDATMVVPDGDTIVAGFDGARYHDATALIATHVESGHQWPLGIWECPFGPAADDWEVPEHEVDAALEAAFDRYELARVYFDPYRWEGKLDEWQGVYGRKVIIEWDTGRGRARLKPMTYALKAYRTAQTAGDLSHDGDSKFTSHIGHAYREYVNLYDDAGERLWRIRKARPDSPNKIDAAMAGCLSWEARGDAIAAGALQTQTYRTAGF